MYFILKGADFSKSNIGKITVQEGAVGGGGNTSGGGSTTTYTFTINPTPSSATVKLTATGYTQSGNSITVPGGTTVSYTVSASGYVTVNGSKQVWSTQTLPITLNTEGGSGGGTSTTKYTITYKYMSGSASIKTQTTEEVTAGTTMNFSTSNAPSINGYTVSSVSPSGQQTINGNITVTYTYDKVSAEVVNLYSPTNNPAVSWYVGNTWTVDSTNTKVITPKNASYAAASPIAVENLPIESGKTYTISLEGAPTSVLTTKDTTTPYYGIVALFFHQTIDGKPSVRYAHSMAGSFTEHVSYWNTSKYSTYTGDIPISETNNSAATFGTTNTYNTGKVEITNLATGVVNNNNRTSVLKGEANYTQAVTVKANDESITHITVIFGNPADGNYITAGAPKDKTTAISTIQDNLVFIEGTL